MADDHSTELQLNHTDNNTTNTNNTSTTSTTKNKSAKIDTPKKQTPTNQLSLNKGLDNQLDIIAPPSITRPLSFLEKNNNTINIKCYFNQPHIREELTSKDDTRIQQIHKNIHKLFEDILSPSAFKIIGATAFVNCNVDKLTSIINLQNQLALNIDKLNYRFDISSNDYAIIKTFIKTYSPKHANEAITNNLTKFTSCTSIESFTVTYSYAVAFKSYIITYHLIDHTHNIVDQKIEQPSGITRYIKAATRSVTKHKIQHAKNADMATTIKNAITNPNMNKNNQPPKNNIKTPPINEIANSNRNNNSLQNSGSKAILNESLDINNQSQNNNEISHKRFTENPNNQHNSYQKAVDTLQLLISKLPPRPTISILTELNSSPLQLKHDFPDHIISVTKRGNGVIIINHNPNTLKLKHISTIDGRAILADVIFPNQLPIGILGIYAPASNNTIKKNSYATSLQTLLHNHSTNPIPNQSQHVSIIAGDFNCIHNDNSLLDDIIQSYTYQHHLIDQGEFKNTPTHTHGNRLDRIYTQYNRIDPENIYTQVHQIPSSLSDHNPISTTFSSPFQINKHKKRWILSPGTANDHEAINIINHLITNHNNTSINQFTNWSKVKSKIIKTLKNYQYNKDKQTQRAKQILLEKAAKFKHLEEQCIAEYNIICNKNKLHQNHTNILKKHINGEIPSKYLSAILNKRSKDAKIESIQYGNIITSDPDQIENAFVEFYTNLYSLQICCPITHQLMLNTWPIIKNEYWNGLDSPFIQEEVEAAIKTCNPNKSPGPDGVTNAFYINHLNQVKPILTTLFNDILENPHHITTEFTEGLIHTIYKKGNPLLISNRRPITLLNTDYKILSKVINARLLRILPFIINNNQTGFVPHRFIIDNIININELINYLKSKNLPGIITLFDFFKAFDSISHDSIKRTLIHIGIPIKLINLIHKLLSDSQAKISINGKTTRKFDIKRGVKQGDPISATLFVIVIEILARTINADNSIIGLPISPNPQIKIKFTQFADDSTTYNINYEQQQQSIKHFDNFCASTSSSLNFDKSAIIEINPHKITDKHIINNIPQSKRIPITKKDQSERVLGYFFNHNGLHRKLPETMKTLIKSLVLWKTSGTTLKTKTTIINTYSLSPITYLSYLEEFTKDEEIQINKLISWFMNSPANSESPTLDTNSIENNTSTIHSRAKIPLMCYDRSLKPLKEGGWGMWNIQLRQVAQKIWIYNRFLQMHKSANNSIYMISWMDQIINKSISSPYLIKIKKEWENYATQIGHLKDKVQILQPIITKNQTSQTLNTNNISLPPTLKEIYSTILNNHLCKSKDYIGKKYSDLLLTSHQQSIQLLWKYTYDQLFVKIQKLKDPKGRDTMQRFHARCLPINHLHNKVCPICNNEMNNDPYGHLFFNCQHTINFINHDKLKYFIYKNCNGNKNWSLTKNQTTKLYTLIYKPQTNNKAFKPDPTININFHFAENAQYKKYRFNWNYINTNLDLVRTHAYWNIISLVIHQIWIWLCKSLFDINITQSIDNWNNQINNTTLDYDILKSKWHKLIRLEYSRTLSNFNQYSIKNNLTKTQKETQWSETIKKFKKEWSINTNEPIPTITPPINY
ncbi:hypothetical protein ACTFIT_008015 [Dictyostelium discoideum]